MTPFERSPPPPSLKCTAIGHPLEGMADFKHTRKTVEFMSHRGRDQFSKICPHLGLKIIIIIIIKVIAG